VLVHLGAGEQGEAEEAEEKESYPGGRHADRLVYVGALCAPGDRGVVVEGFVVSEL
jgi:hypothetical protein